MDKEAYEPKDLFSGISHTPEDEYKLVWSTERVKKELSKLSEKVKQIQEELTLPSNPTRQYFIDTCCDCCAAGQVNINAKEF